MSTSNLGHPPVSRDQVLVAHAADMIARTGFSQEAFAQHLSVHLHRLIPAKAVSKDVPDFDLLMQGDTGLCLRAAGAWLRRVRRWLTGDIDLPCWIEEAWVASLTGDFHDRCLNELASRHGLTGARELPGDGNPVGAFGQLVSRLGVTVQQGSEILADGRIDHDDLHRLPEFIVSLRSVEARCSELRSRAEQVLQEQRPAPALHQVNAQ